MVCFVLLLCNCVVSFVHCGLSGGRRKPAAVSSPHFTASGYKIDPPPVTLMQIEIERIGRLGKPCQRNEDARHSAVESRNLACLDSRSEQIPGEKTTTGLSRSRRSRFSRAYANLLTLPAAAAAAMAGREGGREGRGRKKQT